MTAPRDPEGDAEIVRLLQAGDVRGVDLLLRIHGGRVKQWLRSTFCRSAHDHILDEAVHDAARNLFRYAKSLRPDGNLPGYFYETAKNHMKRLLKKERWHRTLAENADQEIAAPTDEAKDASELAKQVAAVIDSLPDLEREILMLDLAYNFTLSAAEMGKRLGTTGATVYSLRNRLKNRLRKLLPPEDQDGVA